MLRLEPCCLCTDDGAIQLDALPDPQPEHPARIAATPMLERLWRIALQDVESNIIRIGGATFFGAGRKFGSAVYTRDIAFSGILGLNRLYPNIIRRSLSHTRELRLQAGFRVPRGHAVPELAAPWQDDLPLADFLGQYGGKHGITRRSDDVVWLWCAHDLVGHDGRQEDWRWLYEYGQRCFDEIYRYFFDPSDGLYRGQAAFIDPHWPKRKTSGYPTDWEFGDCVLLKALSTNCLYVLGLEAMADAAGRLNADAGPWEKQANSLRAAIRRELCATNGRFCYYKDRHGVLSYRREALGTALLLPAGIVSAEEATECVLDYPVTDHGAPLFVPFFDGELCNHNHSAWPFVDTFLLRAFEAIDGRSRAEFNAALLARTCIEDGSFHEKVDFRNGKVFGSGSQLWTAAAFVDCCRRLGLWPSSAPGFRHS
jgi:hypothetical protein